MLTDHAFLSLFAMVATDDGTLRSEFSAGIGWFYRDAHEPQTPITAATVERVAQLGVSRAFSLFLFLACVRVCSLSPTPQWHDGLRVCVILRV